MDPIQVLSNPIFSKKHVISKQSYKAVLQLVLYFMISSLYVSLSFTRDIKITIYIFKNTYIYCLKNNIYTINIDLH